MTYNQLVGDLREVGWRRDDERLQHRINGEVCYWFDGQISGVDHSAWISCSGKVYLHAGQDLKMDEFTKIVRNGWPVVSKGRSLFGDEDL